ncbi:MAG TPA: hypothetical protein VMW16_13545 [Sedimentisphaerales bacterium]|nr:hypothetical protein [Sedimentisphaerales bacterium]
MKRILLLAALFGAAFSAGSVLAEASQQLDLDGRQVVVRLYECGTENPNAFKQTTLQLNGDGVVFDFVDADETTFVVIFGEDQRDKLVRQVLGNRIYGWAYKEGLEFRLLQEVPGGEQTDCDLTFVDGLAQPIPRADVRIHFKCGDKRVLIDRRQLDEKGRLTGIPCCSKASAGLNETRCEPFYFEVFQPEYGSAFVAQTAFERHDLYYVPLVPAGSEADNRSIWGRVVDANGQPVGGATIYGIAIITLGDDWIRTVSGQTHGVTTDPDGRFRMYLPPSEEAYQVGPMVPPKTKYTVKVEPPPKSGLLPACLHIMNGQPAKVTLEYADYFHTFAFEDQNGTITDPNVLRDIRVVVRREGRDNNLCFDYEQWKEGAKLPLGRYDARYPEDPTQDKYKFQSLEVTADSPEQLVFRAKPARTYKGRVVNGITGQPMGGAFVVASRGCNGRSSLAYLTAEEWATLHRLQKIPPMQNDLEFQSVKVRMEVLFRFICLVRTDASGSFEVNSAAKTQLDRFVVFEQDYVPYHLPASWSREDGNGTCLLPEAKLFPAAKVSVRPAFAFAVDPNRRRMLGLPPWWLVGPQWFIDKDKSLAWAENLLAACGQQADHGLFRGNQLEVTQIQGDYRPHRFLVPAGVTLRLNLCSPGYVGCAPITVAENLKLRQGQFIDLGRHRILDPFPVVVQVLNSQGSPVEGVPVVVCGGCKPPVSSTDENGFAFFEFVGYSKGEFIVEYRPDDKADAPILRQVVPYHIEGPQDANTVYTLTVSDELLNRLLK